MLNVFLYRSFEIVWIVFLGFTISLLLLTQSHASWVRLEGGVAQSKWNYFQIPGDTGTRVQLPSGQTQPYARVEASVALGGPHSLRFVALPLQTRYKVTPGESVNFNGKSFAANQELDVGYKFNSWRVGYAYEWLSGDGLKSQIGVTAKIRDAFIEVSDGAQASRRSDLGFVPLLFGSFDWTWSESWGIYADVDALGGGPGYAIDGRLEVQSRLSSEWLMGVGYRVLTGGANTDSVENFATFNFGYLSIQRFL